MPGGVVNALARLLAGGLFLVSGLAKLWAPGPFPAAVSRLVPVPAVSGLVVVGLPVAEVLLGVLVLSGRCLRLVCLVVLVLAVAFVGVRLFEGFNSVCGCFGEIELGERVGLVLDLLLLVCSLVLAARAWLSRPDLVEYGRRGTPAAASSGAGRLYPVGRHSLPCTSRAAMVFAAAWKAEPRRRGKTEWATIGKHPQGGIRVEPEA